MEKMDRFIVLWSDGGPDNVNVFTSREDMIEYITALVRTNGLSPIGISAYEGRYMEDMDVLISEIFEGRS